MAKPTPEKVAELKARIAKDIRDANPEFIIGVDEVGFGSVAGPLVIGAVGVPVDWVPPVGLTDSKDLSRKQVATLAEAFLEKTKTEHNLKWCRIWTESWEIDVYGLGPLRRRALIRGIDAIRELYESHTYPREPRTLAIVDGNLNIPDSVSLPKADLIVPAVSMASVIAKYLHDIHMIEQAKAHPGYGWETNVGYDTEEHREAIKRLGPCSLHRMSTRTLKNIVPRWT
jgi:ribonuclease HII